VDGEILSPLWLKRFPEKKTGFLFRKPAPGTNAPNIFTNYLSGVPHVGDSTLSLCGCFRPLWSPLLGKTSVFYSDPLPLGIIIEADSRQLAVEKGRPLTAGLDGRVALCPP